MPSPLATGGAFDLGWALQPEALRTGEGAGRRRGELSGGAVAAAHRAVLRVVQGATRHGCNTTPAPVSRSGRAVQGQVAKDIYSKRGRLATLPVHLGFSSSQSPDEAQRRRGGPTSSNPSSQSNAQVVFQGKLPGPREHFTDPLAGRVRGPHSATADVKEHRECHRGISPPVQPELIAGHGSCR